VRHSDGIATLRVNQQQTGGRWVRLGDFRFEAGAGAVMLSNSADPDKVVVADSIKATKWPNIPRDFQPLTGETTATQPTNLLQRH
jgi:hypothetical protein